MLLPFGAFEQRVGAVLDELEKLPMGIAAVGRTVFVVGLFGNETRLLAVRAEGLLRLLDDELSDPPIRTGPIRLLASGGEAQLRVAAEEPPALGRREIVFALHSPDSN